MSSSSALSSVPLEPEDISREWLFEVINQFRASRGLSLIENPDDIATCSIDECETSHGYLSTTYKLKAQFRCKSPATGTVCRPQSFPLISERAKSVEIWGGVRYVFMLRCIR